MFVTALFLTLQTLASPGTGFQPPDGQAELERQIEAADTVLFDAVFNRCELDHVPHITTDDVTMVHDQGGVDRGREAFFAPIRQYICSGEGPKPLREADPGTMEVWPLYDSGRLYGALQQGRHSFYLRDDAGAVRLTNRARYMHVWSLSETGWRLQTALSFEHINPDENHAMDMDVLVAGFDRRPVAEALLDAHRIPGLAVALVEAGAVTEVSGFGQAAPDRPVTVDTVFNVASLAKPVTALVALRLSEAGRWDLDRPLADLALDPLFAASPEAHRVTTRHVLSHMSGLPNWRYLEPEGAAGFAFEPGSGYRYSGEGFEWLRQALEAGTGESLEALARDLVFAPAGMTRTSYLHPGREPVAARFDRSGAPIPVTPHDTANGAANLMTTAGDYARFIVFLLDGAGLSEPLQSALFANQLPAAAGTEFGLGWDLETGLPGGETAFLHTGQDEGVQAIAIGLVDSRRALVILSNSNHAVPAWSGILTEAWPEMGPALIARARD